MKRKKKIQRNKEVIDMAVLTKPSVFELKVTKENYNEVHKKINEPRLTKEYINECLSVSENLRRNKGK